MLDAACRQRRQQRRREMQPRRRCRDRAIGGGEHGLVVVALRGRVGHGRPDIGRQRHPAVPTQALEQGRFRQRKGQRQRAGRPLGCNGCRQIRREVQPIRQTAFACRPGERQPSGFAVWGGGRLDQGHLDRRLAPAAGKPGRQHAGIVEQQQVARLQQVRQIGNPAVAQAGRADLEQPRPIARHDRPLRDQLRGQDEIELGNLHRPGIPTPIVVRAQSTAWRGRLSQRHPRRPTSGPQLHIHAAQPMRIAAMATAARTLAASRS